MGKESRFDEWLREAMAGRPNVWLVRAGPLKGNGRPVIDDSRVSKWISGEQRPSMENAILVARLLERPPSEALIAAGYQYGHSLETLDRIDAEHHVVGGSDQADERAEHREPSLAAVSDEELAAEVLRRMRAKEAGETAASVGKPGERDLDAERLGREAARAAAGTQRARLAEEAESHDPRGSRRDVS